MIQITPHMRIWVAVEPIDFRAGIDGLAAACRKRLQADPFSGALFVCGCACGPSSWRKANSSATGAGRGRTRSTARS